MASTRITLGGSLIGFRNGSSSRNVLPEISNNWLSFVFCYQIDSPVKSKAAVAESTDSAIKCDHTPCSAMKYETMIDGRPVNGQSFELDMKFLSRVGFPIGEFNGATSRSSPSTPSSAIPDDLVFVTAANANVGIR